MAAPGTQPDVPPERKELDVPHDTPADAPRPRPRRRAAAVLAALVLGAGWSLTLTPPAHAHTDLLASSPAAGDVVSASTDRLILSFVQPVEPSSGTVTVVGPDGEDATAGDVDVQGALVQVPLHLRGTGPHTVAYRVVAADGHVVTGGLTFRAGPDAADAPLTRSTSTSPEAAASSGSQDVPRPWLWSGATAILAAALVALHRARRRPRGGVIVSTVPDIDPAPPRR